ncbi:xanthine dehydrogenase family protein molybdopterin-binding subunit [Bacillus sp. ISL-57]|uniref:xanthine dehydrogenase family protein molybdopterin-binding subunit n=1 Tax=Bacillus sp. ISL-57 TaxID=2819135 RepID=UPI001BE970A1|nr:xanthine dehydrogenase family protein molybdopterin-binding subunit [Bacillus sp. ISL-57]MBT2717509.1 xanthine dehydrogenase family protein molybdopterin-binding subunit [Bacillus sp. ISL-57]
MTKYVGQSYKRKEDYRLLTGKSQFVADIKLTDMVEAVVIRSTYALALIKNIDKTAAEKLPGVQAVIIASDIEGKVKPLPSLSEFSLPKNLLDSIKPVIKPCPEDLLAKNHVVYVGQPVAIIVAEDRYIAEDAAALVKIEYEALKPVTDPYEGMDDGAPTIHPHLGNNIQAQFDLSIGNTKDVFIKADHVLETKIKTPRVTASPMETRGVVAEYDTRLDRLEVWSSTQVNYMVRTNLSKLLSLDENKIRVIAPDMGGGFGAKCAVYPEEILIPYLAKVLERPVRWIEDRLEHMMSTRHARDQIHKVKVAYENDGTILGIQDEFVVDNGAYNPLLLTVSYNTAAHMRGLYKIDHFDIKGYCVLTNKAPNIAYRGAGRPEAVYVMDRVIDMIAEQLDVDPIDIMLKNMIKHEDMPYDQGMYYRDGFKVIYDSGDYPASFKKALKLADYEAFRSNQKELKSQGKYVGIGISSYVEGTGIGPYEGAIVRLDETGKFIVSVGSTPHGQSHETTFSQICADELMVSPDDVTVRAGDTDVVPFGIGTFASRSAVTAGNAVHIASKKLRGKIIEIASVLLGENTEQLILKNGKIFNPITPDKIVSLNDIIQASRPGQNCKLPEDMEPNLETSHYFSPETVTYSSGFHIAIVEVDKETGYVTILKYIVVDDCGRMLNPMIVAGQVQGGVAQGIGAALYEEIVYDDIGQLMTGTYMDYLVPTSIEIPDVVMGEVTSLSTRNPMGIKGVGEAGTISPPAAIANAVRDALHPLKIEITDLPLSPSRIFHLIKEAEFQRQQ